jgi:tetratricopeptide (TPR) repeat protein
MCLTLGLGVAKAAAHDDTSPEPTTYTTGLNPEARHLLAIGHAYDKDGQPEKARQHYARAVELAPDYWVAWMRLADAMTDTGQLTHATNAYARMLELKKRCDSGQVTPCPDLADEETFWPSSIYNAGWSLLFTGRYAQAADAFKQAIPLQRGKGKSAAIEWLAVARFADTDLQTAWNEYRDGFEGAPFPDQNEEGLSRAQARGAKHPPKGFYRLVRTGMVNLRNTAYRAQALYYDYIHAQNVARAEAEYERATRKIIQPTPYETRESREYIIGLFNEIRKHRTGQFTPDYIIQPALSRHAVANAHKAEAAVARKDYHAAEDLYRMAVATDPWWVEGLQNLLQLEFINYGWCGPRETLNILEDLARLGIGTIPDSPHEVTTYYPDKFIKDWETRLRDIWDEAAESGSQNLKGWCEIDAPNMSVVYPKTTVVE